AKWSRWTQSEIGGLNPAAFCDPALVRYPSTGGVQVPAFVYKPRDSNAERHPVVIIWHGGPEGQSRPNFYPLIQFLVNELGVAVVVPNVRGSDGYGKAFLSADNGIKRE